MDARMLARSISELTDSLRPGHGTTGADLDRVRFLLASALLSGQTAEEFRGTATLGTSPNITNDVSRFEHLLAANPISAVRAFARSVPSPTSLHASTPEWARGIAVAHSAGPFLTPLGNPIWIDAFDVVQQTTLTRDSATLVGLFPVDATQSTSRNLALGSGSVWLPARLLDANSPNSSYTGFRIKSGTLSLSDNATPVSAGTLDISLTTIATLTVILDGPAQPLPAPGPGVDAAAATITLPTSVTIKFAPAGATLTTLTDSSADVYGQTVALHWNGAAPVFEANTNEIVTLLTVSTASFHVGTAQSKVLQPAGTAPIQAASWALPVAITTPADLGAAAGAGALLLAIGPGLAEQWTGLVQPAALSETWLHLVPGQIVILAAGSTPQPDPQTFDLWGTSTIDFTRAHAFGSFFLSQPGLEWFEVNGAAAAHLDRPLRADGSRFALKVSAGLLLLSQTAQGFGISIGLALNNKPPETASLVLENALVVVDPPAALSVFGELNPANLAALQAGTAGLEFAVRGLLPILPDPYASSFTARDFSSSSGAPLGLVITAVSWKAPETPELDFFIFLNQSSLTGGGGLPDERGVALLDLSTNADLFGVRYSLLGANPTVRQMALVLPGAGFTVFTVPQVSWEPMKSEPTESGLHSSDDGTFRGARHRHSASARSSAMRRSGRRRRGCSCR
jgi:hypothetical protein